MIKIHTQEPVPNRMMNQLSYLIPRPPKTTTAAEATASVTPKQQKRKCRRVLQTNISCPKSQPSKVIKTRPGILGCRIKSKIQPKLDFLQERLQWDDVTLLKAIKSQPSILTFNIEDNLEPKLEWVQRRLQLDATSTGKVIQKCPTILASSVSENMEPKLDWLQKRLGLNDDQLSRMVWKCPTLFHYSITDKMEPTLLWLQNRLRLSNKGLSRVLMGLPSLFGCDVHTNLVPTFKFYQQCIGTKEAQVLLASNPVLFSASLKGRLKPRLEEAKKLGLEVDSGMLKRIAKYTEGQWCRSVT